MPRKVYTIENLDCANCAAKIEAKFNALPEVEEATITFATGQLRLTAEDPDALIPKLTEIARTVEHGAAIVDRKGHGHRHEHQDHECGCDHHHEEGHTCGCGHHHEEGHTCGCGHHHEEGHTCGCGHHHDHDHECNCGHHHDHDHAGHSHEHSHGEHAGDLKCILIGAVLFSAGLILGALGLATLAKVVYIAAWLVLGWEILSDAVKNLTGGHILDENFLMSIASIGAFFIGEFPEAVGVMLFYRVGEYFEHVAVERSRSQIMEAVDLRPEVVNLLRGDAVEVIPAEDAQVGDVLLVRPGDRIPLDGTVLSGESRIDTAPITGEPVPVSVRAGDIVTSGCVNTTGQLTVRVDKPLSESMVTRILDSVENAAASKPKIDRFITRFARVYTPAVVLGAVIVAIVPSLITGDWSYWVYTALSLLVMSCPCALVLSVPLAFFSGIGAGSRKGILFKGGMSIEALANVKAVIMDKTGTLTKGEFKVRQVAGGHEVLQLCASCEQHSTHPIAQSIVTCARERNMALFTPDSLEELPGQGIRAMSESKRILCGNARLIREHGVKFQEVDEAEASIVYVAVDDRFVGYITVSDIIKENAPQAAAQLHKAGIHTVMLTGDSEASARAVAEKLGIGEVHAKLLPHQKLEQLRRIRKDKGAAMFVGDGINDAPVLAGADVGAAMGSGADAAIVAADVVFMTSDPEAIPESIAIAKNTAAIAWQNVVFALGVKAIVMILGLLGYASMWLAVFADSGVAMLCVLNSIRVLYQRK